MEGVGVDTCVVMEGEAEVAGESGPPPLEVVAVGGGPPVRFVVTW